MNPFRPNDPVWISYPNSAAADRGAVVVDDDGGPKVKVRWQTRRPDPGRPGRRRAFYYGPEHVQSIPRERIKPRSVVN
jgi:hypothetical protein